MDKIVPDKKNQQIEFIRAVCVMSVVSIHTINSGLIYKGQTYAESLVVFFTVWKNVLYWAVPCFGIISGMLLLNPNKELSIKKIYGKYLVRMVLVLLIFGTVFSWIEIFFSKRNFAFSQIPRAFILVLTNQTWAHLWYMYALISVYLVLPIYRWISLKKNDVLLICIAVVILILMFVSKSREISLHLYFLLGEVFRRKFMKLK